jgi:cytochrome c
MIRGLRRLAAVAGTLGVMLAAGGPPASAGEAGRPQMVLPLPDAGHGRFLFVSKGCVVCHSVNGAGGKAGPALDAPETPQPVAPLEFAARMWRGAVAMAVLQSMEFGYQIELSGDEIADLAAFAADAAAQDGFSDQDIPEVMRGWTVDENFPPPDAALPGAEAH